MVQEKAGKMIGKIALRKRVKPLYTLGISYQLLGILKEYSPALL